MKQEQTALRKRGVVLCLLVGIFTGVGDAGSDSKAPRRQYYTYHHRSTLSPAKVRLLLDNPTVLNQMLDNILADREDCYLLFVSRCETQSRTVAGQRGR